jgi:hypothetical protein
MSPKLGREVRGFAVGLAIVGILLSWALLIGGGCGPKPGTPEGDLAAGKAFRERGIGPGFVKDPAGMRIHDIDPELDLTYFGAFGGPSDLDFGDGAKEYYAYGDNSRGSLFCTGHRVYMGQPGFPEQLYEITIPRPVIANSYGALYRGSVLQGGSPYRGEMKLKDVEIWWRGGAQRLHGQVGKHYEYTDGPRHFAFRLNLANPQTVGPWNLTPNAIETNGYLFQLPEWFAYRWTEGRRLVCGRHRDGQGPSGPTLYAYNPYNTAGELVESGAMLSVTTLLRYDDLACWENPSDNCIIDHCPEDAYTGAAFIEDGPRRAVVFARRKAFDADGDGTARCWYGYPNGQTCPPVCECSNCGGNRGFQAEALRAELAFFRARDLGLVAAGLMEPWEPQPYAVLDLTSYLIGSGPNLGGVAYCPKTEVPPDDPHSGWLFVTELYDDGVTERPVFHVFKVGR